MSGDQSAIALAEKVLLLLEQGSFSATYKYALFTAILDLCLERTAKTGEPPSMLTTRQLAEKIIELYWPHATAYVAPNRPSLPLRQGGARAGSQAEILRDICEFRAKSGQDMLFRARSDGQEQYERLVHQVEWTLVEWPIPRLQRFGLKEERFLYSYEWTQEVRQGQVSAYQRGEAGAFDNCLRLRPGVAEDLVRLNGVLRPLLRREWAQMVARMNKLHESSLEDFLFGMERESLRPVRGPLRELQGGHCFYCGHRMDGETQVDHFVPWARYPDNGLDNLVLAHATCNNQKRDFLAAAEHVEHWSLRLRNQDTTLADLATKLRWEREPERTHSVAVAMYRRLADESVLWLRSAEFVPPEMPRIRAALEAARAT